MQTPTLTRETWRQAVAELGLRLEVVAVATGKSHATVYAYSRGLRNPSDEWLVQVSAIVAAESAQIREGPDAA